MAATSSNELGYKQELFRGLNFFGTLSSSFAQQGVLASTTLLYGYGLTNGGPAVMIYVWIFGSLLSCISCACLAEICSKLPFAGSVYNWSGELSPKRYSPVISYTTGWLNLLGNATSAVGYSFGFGQFVAALYDIGRSDGGLSLGYQVLIAMIGTLFMAAVNVFRVDSQGWLNFSTLIFSLGALVGICIALMVNENPKQSIAWVFETTYNGSGFSSFTYVVFTAVLTVLFGVAGYEASAHLAEETENPRLIAPWGMVFNIATTCVFGFIYLLTLLINTPSNFDDDGSVLNTNYANPAIAVFVNCVGENWARVLTALIVYIGFMAGLANMTISIRVTWAMARDGALPFSKWLLYVHPSTSVPVNAIIALLAYDLVMLLIPLGSTLAFAALISISTIGFQASYFVPIVQRLTSGIFVQDENFNLGAFSMPLHFISAVFLFVTSIICFFPQQAPVNDVNNFNWAIAVTPVYCILGGVYWMLYARHTFTGPLQTLHGETESVPQSDGDLKDREDEQQYEESDLRWGSKCNASI